MIEQIVITEKTSQAKDVRAAVGGRHGTILPAEGHLFDLIEPDEVSAEWKHWTAVLLRPGGYDGMPELAGRRGQIMEQRLHRIETETRGRGLVAITDQVCGWAKRQDFVTVLLTIWCRHTSASLLVQENASLDVRADLEAFFRRLVPDGGNGRYRHEDEGPDDMPAHIRAALTQTHLSIPVADGRPVLGTWQGIYLWKHRTSPHQRELVLHLLGEPSPN